jgi:hypothetical protein
MAEVVRFGKGAKANLVQDDRYLLTCMRYIELNHVRADMVSSIRRQLPWPVVLPHLIITLTTKALPHLKDTS